MGLFLPKKLEQPTLRTEIMVGTLDYGPLRVATGTMGYKHREADLAHVKASLEAPNFLLKIIPHVDGRPRICELVEYRLEEIALDRASGPIPDASRIGSCRRITGYRDHLRNPHPRRPYAGPGEGCP